MNPAPFNRTFVELKSWRFVTNACFLQSFNRTFVELKSRLAGIGLFDGNTLLIEPLWNWNKRREEQGQICYSLLIEPLWNWNNALVRLGAIANWLLIEPLWNWNTSVHPPLSFLSHAFNRTFVELKSQYRTAYFYRRRLLIEPLWNWNFIVSARLTKPWRF